MIEFSTIAAVVAVAAAALAAGARDLRAVAAGLAVAMLAAPFASSPLPATLPLAARVAGALLGADLLWVAARAKGIRTEGTAIGFPADAAFAAAAFLAGYWIAPVAPIAGTTTGQAAGVALVVLAIVPLAGSDALRAGVGAALLCLGLTLLRETWVGPAPALEDLAVAVLLAGIPGATAMLMAPAATFAAASSAGVARRSLAEQAPEAGPVERPVALAPARSAGVSAEAAPEGAPGEPERPAVPGAVIRRTRKTTAKSAPPAPTPNPTPAPARRPGRYAGAHLDLRRRHNPRERGDGQ